jgi:heme-degrading monooxygenase HmoA
MELRHRPDCTQVSTSGNSVTGGLTAGAVHADDAGMFVSITRLRVRKLRYLVPFLFQSLRSSSQARRSDGNLSTDLLKDASNTFWTRSVWRDEAAMRAFMMSGAHRKVMPRLLEWCDEASVCHWTQEGSELPSWAEAHRRMVADGRRSKVNHPSPAHTAFEIPAPRA